MKKTIVIVCFFVAFGNHILADLTNPSTLILKETEPSMFTVELTLPVIQGRVLRARPVIPDICVVEGDPQVRGDATKAIRTWKMTCDSDELAGTAIGVQGLLGTSFDVQLTIETLGGRRYEGRLYPTQAYYLVPLSPTIFSLAADVGQGAMKRVLRHPELIILFVILVFYNIRLPRLITSAGIFSITLAVGQWLKTENWIGVSLLLPVTLTGMMVFFFALNIIKGKTSRADFSLGIYPVLLALIGLLYGGGGLPVDLALSRSEQNLSFLFSALGTLTGLVLAIFCAHQLQALALNIQPSLMRRLQFWIAYFGGLLACALILYQISALLFGSVFTPLIPLTALVGATALGLWCGIQQQPARKFLPYIVGLGIILGTVLSLQSIYLPQPTLVLYGSLTLLGVTIFRRVHWPVWAVTILAAVSSLYLGVRAGISLQESTVLPVTQSTSMITLLIFLFLVTYHQAGQRGSENLPIKVFGLTTAFLAVLWRFAEYSNWIGEDVAIEATMGLFRLPVLTILLGLTALLIWPRKRKFQPVAKRKRTPIHLGIALLALFTLPVGGYAVRNPFFTPRAPTVDDARPIMGKLLTDTYLAFNLLDEDDAFDQLAQNLSEDLVPGVYLDSRRRLTAGTREGAEVTVKKVNVLSIENPDIPSSSNESFTYPCKWVVTARVRHWQHIHDRQNIYVGEITIRVENDRWKISHLELLSEEREIVSGRNT